MIPAMDAEQRIIHFEGNVQGVGFRYTACRTAEGFGVTGTVQNLPDGRVRCVVEGSAREIDAFLDDLTARMQPYIRRQTQQTAPASGRFHAFQVVH